MRPWRLLRRSHRKAAEPPPCTSGKDIVSVDAFVECLNETYGLELPRADQVPDGSSIHALYGLPISGFEPRPGYRYWADVGDPWQPFSEPTQFVPASVAVFLGDVSTPQQTNGPAPSAAPPPGGTP